jgi:TonB family protein
MKVIVVRLALAVGIVVLASNTCNPSQEDAPILDRDVHFTSYEEISYPPMAAQARIGGVVVVKVKLDDHGKVTHATAISGQELLIQSAVANAKKWQFEPNSRNVLVLVYNFREAAGLCHRGAFVFEPPNFITITACAPVINED